MRGCVVVQARVSALFHWIGVSFIPGKRSCKAAERIAFFLPPGAFPDIHIEGVGAFKAEGDRGQWTEKVEQY